MVSFFFALTSTFGASVNASKLFAGAATTTPEDATWLTQPWTIRCAGQHKPREAVGYQLRIVYDLCEVGTQLGCHLGNRICIIGKIGVTRRHTPHTDVWIGEITQSPTYPQPA